MPERRVCNPLQLVTREDVARSDSYLRADVTGDAVIVPGDNLDLNTILL